MSELVKTFLSVAAGDFPESRISGGFCDDIIREKWRVGGTGWFRMGLGATFRSCDSTSLTPSFRYTHRLSYGPSWICWGWGRG